MPWEKSFDLDNALDRAIKIFWAKGYEGTSMADLVDEMGINKGSLYNAFGSKQELFTKALLKYDRDNRQKKLEQLEALDDPVKAITKFFDGLIEESSADKEKKGCLLFNTALELPNQTHEVHEAVGFAINDLEAFFIRQIKSGQKRGDLAKSLKPNPTAKSLIALLVGFRVLSRGAYTVKELKTVKDSALKLICDQ